MNDQTHPEPRDIPIGIHATGTRCETDSIGEIEVPVDRYWGAQTQLVAGGIGCGSAASVAAAVLSPGAVTAKLF